MKIMASGPITSWQIDGEKMETVMDFIFLGSKITVDGDCSHEIKTPAPWKKSYDKPTRHIKKQRHHFADQGLSNQSYGFSRSCVWLWELDRKEGWALKNWCFRTVVLEKTLKNPLDSKEIKPVNFKGLEGLFLNIHWKDWCWNWNSNTLATWCKELTHWKRPWCWERLRAGGEGDKVGWHHWLNECELEQTPGDSEGQGSLVCFSPWGRKESDTTEGLDNNCPPHPHCRSHSWRWAHLPSHCLFEIPAVCLAVWVWCNFAQVLGFSLLFWVTLFPLAASNYNVQGRKEKSK